MTPTELERYLHEHIPLSKAMQVAVEATDPDRVVLSAPLAPNINHRETAFGGSISAVAILAAWSLLHTRLAHAGFRARLVIQRNTMEYTQPIAGRFRATASIPGADAWEAFTRMLRRKGRARLAVSSVLEHEGRVAGRFEGDFVALGAEEG